MSEVIAEAVRARQRCESFLVGLDLAGDESGGNPREYAACFEPAFRECLSITIHAGEGQPAEKIWEAAYHLHADRIGHGLTLAAHSQLARRFRDRGICVELCPTSNREVVGFPLCGADAARAPVGADVGAYPIRAFIERGVPVTLCTDNPGISRTDMTGEIVTASRMAVGGMTVWEALAILRQGFVHAFAPAALRNALLGAADTQIRGCLETYPWGAAR
jgi:adenosine deaminase